MTLNIIGYKKTYLAISTTLIVVALACTIVFGFHLGIDFTGGTLWQVQISQDQPTPGELTEVLSNTLRLNDPKVSFDSQSNSFFIRLSTVKSADGGLQELKEVDHQRILADMKTRYPSASELSFQSIGPSVSGALRKNAIIAMILVLIGISLYIAFAFRKVSKPVSSWKYGWVTLFTLFHDVIIPAGLLAVLGKIANVEIDTNFVVALLVVMGFSVHDTIVVFDRIRENLFTNRSKSDFTEVVNSSINQTIARSLNTSLTLILVLVALYFTGPLHLKYFILTLLVGVITGIYSSIFVASPALVLLSPAQVAKRK